VGGAEEFSALGQIITTATGRRQQSEGELPRPGTPQSVNVTEAQNATCVWRGNIIRGKLWNHVTYQREYHFRLDLGNISRDGITVEQATPENPRCSIIRSDLLYFVYRSDLPYAVRLTFNKSLDVSFQVKADQETERKIQACKEEQIVGTTTVYQ
jgi:hypothetical protein